jgi:hypothetical protein
VTVRFSAVGVISWRWDLAKVFTLFGGCCSDDGHFSNSVTPGGSRPQSASNEIDPRGCMDRRGVSRAPRHGSKICRSTGRRVNKSLRRSRWRCRGPCLRPDHPRHYPRHGVSYGGSCQSTLAGRRHGCRELAAEAWP